ncbi:hypothetical protein KP729_000768|uniref:hypothetical protein n=1 Tax=Delftia acidovorans TaxID=80866 RepID=UPI001C0E7EE0|nr:hypothetical protein [Delftia acidovorans]MCA1067420.1 hypothetical protein [Delftia acidovorans]
MNNQIELQSLEEATAIFCREVGVANIEVDKQYVGNLEFLKFKLGKECPLYAHALFATQQNLSPFNIYKGALGITTTSARSFPESIEARALLTLLARSTREVSQGDRAQGYTLPYVPFQHREDHTLAQPANHIVRGRRGVGKSTLIRRASELLSHSKAAICVIDMQSYSTLGEDDLQRELFIDICSMLHGAFSSVASRLQEILDLSGLQQVKSGIFDGSIATNKIPISLKRAISSLTKDKNYNAFIFLDDFHLINREIQPKILHSLLASLKGANAWLKIIGITSLLNTFDPKTSHGLQTPGDAEFISLDLTLENPEAAENHLKSILKGFLHAVGYEQNTTVMSDAAFRRLAWANAGVPRDFLQMFSRSLEHAARNKHTSVTLSDINVAIGEFGQQKLRELEVDARNDAGKIREMLDLLESLCLETEKKNAFLIRSTNSTERLIVQILSDLRLVHLIHQSITPKKAGERFEAFILDYSLFTGFRRRPNVVEMIPKDSQFKASELRALPKVMPGFFSKALESS